YAPNLKFTSAIIGKDYYESFDITVTEIDKIAVISNGTSIFSKPLFDANYKVASIEKGTQVTALCEVEFNGVSMTLISTSEDKTPTGYVITGYLNGEILTETTLNSETITVLTSDGRRHFNSVLMITIIALTVTCVALFIEKKLLFDKEDGNKTN
ncbi:MAG: hypothetical protein IJA97_00730, partial [Clostridia bacterium]|nr:hypothetical protein [Clostridia bacterium]